MNFRFGDPGHYHRIPKNLHLNGMIFKGKYRCLSNLIYDIVLLAVCAPRVVRDDTGRVVVAELARLVSPLAILLRLALVHLLGIPPLLLNERLPPLAMPHGHCSRPVVEVAVSLQLPHHPHLHGCPRPHHPLDLLSSLPQHPVCEETSLFDVLDIPPCRCTCPNPLGQLPSDVSHLTIGEVVVCGLWCIITFCLR